MRINDIEGLLISAYMDWSSFIGNYRVARRDSIITWTDRVPRMLDHPVMASDVVSLANDGQYTFQVHDGSLIQMYYSFDRRGFQLQAARLAFYSAVVDNKLINAYKRSISVDTISDYEQEFNDEIALDEPDEVEKETQFGGLKNGPVSWLRIEYAPQAAMGVLHHDCHIHFSTFPNSRFVVAGVPNPRQFIEFIMAFCYPELYRTHRLNNEGQYINLEKINSVNSTCFPLIEDAVFNQIAHFRIPTANG